MLSRGLLHDATEATAKASNGHVTCSAVQRRIRVGFATAAHLVDALEAAGVLGAIDSHGRRQVLARDAEWGHRLVDEAIADGRIELTGTEADRQHWPSCTRFDRPVDGHDLECGCWCHRQVEDGTGSRPSGGETGE